MKDPRKCARGGEHVAIEMQPTQCNRCAKAMPPESLVKRYLATVEVAKVLRDEVQVGRSSDWDEVLEDDQEMWVIRAGKIIDAYRSALANG